MNNPYHVMLITWHDELGNDLYSTEAKNEQEARDEMLRVRQILYARIRNKKENHE